VFAAVDAYDRLVGRYSGSLAIALMDFAGVEPGMRVLDVGAGPGALTSALVGRLGEGGVAAVEPSDPFAAACRRRVPGVMVHVAGAEDLPFTDDGFDAALSQLVVNFMADAHAGVGEMLRVTKPGGTVAAATWDLGGGMTVLDALWASAREVTPAAAEADERETMRFCREDELVDLWREAGAAGVRSGALDVEAAYDSFDDLWEPFTTGVGPSGAFVASLPADERTALGDALRRRLGVADAPFTLGARAWAVAGTVPQ